MARERASPLTPHGGLGLARYTAGYCDVLHRTEEDDTGDGKLAWFYDEYSQCRRCQSRPTLALVLLSIILLIGVPLGYRLARFMTEPERVPIASPVVSIIALLQIACTFDDALAGGMWPPMVAALLEALNPFLRLDMHSFNVECAFGVSLLPPSFLGKYVLGSWTTAIAAAQAYVLFYVLSFYVPWPFLTWRRRQLATAPWAVPPHHIIPGSAWSTFWACSTCMLLSAWIARLAALDTVVLWVPILSIPLPASFLYRFILCLQLPSTLVEMHLLAQHVYCQHENIGPRRAMWWCVACCTTVVFIAVLCSVPLKPEPLPNGETEYSVRPQGPVPTVLLLSHFFLATALLWQGLGWRPAWNALHDGGANHLATLGDALRALLASPGSTPLEVFMLATRAVVGLAIVGLAIAAASMMEQLDDDWLLRIMLVPAFLMFHVIFVAARQFFDPSFLRVLLFVLGVMYLPAATACIRRLEYLRAVSNLVPSLLFVNGGIIWVFLGFVPGAQFYTLRSIQREAIADILWWPGMKAGTERSPMAKRFGTLYLRQQIRLDSRLLRVTCPRDLPDLPMLRGLTWTTLPYYFEVIVTLRKLIIVVVCSYLGGPGSSIFMLQVLLGAVLIAFTELIVATRPYNDNDYSAEELTEAATTPGGRKLVALRRAALLDCNKVERMGTYCLLIFLGCAAYFQNKECNDEEQSDTGCRLLDVFCLLAFLGAFAAAFINPVRLMYFTLRDHSGPQWDFFLSHYQATGNDTCKLLSLEVEKRGFSAWLDQEVDQITPTTIRNGVMNAQHYVLLLSEGALQRPFVVIELMVATIAEKKPVILHSAGMLERRRGMPGQAHVLHFLRPEDMNPGTRSNIWSDELLDQLWSFQQVRTMVMQLKMDTRRASVTVLPKQSALLASIDVVAVRNWALVFDGLMRRHHVLDKHGKLLQASSITLSLGSILQITYEQCLLAARIKFEQIIPQMECHFIRGFTSKLIDVESCSRCAQELVDGLPSRTARHGIPFLAPERGSARTSFAEWSSGRTDTSQLRTSTIFVLGGRDVEWQRAILQQLLMQRNFLIIPGSAAEGIAELERTEKEGRRLPVVLWFLSHCSLGSKWRCVGAERPQKGHELVCEPLKEALRTRQTFRKAEVQAFQARDLRVDSFIRVGGQYFEQDAGFLGDKATCAVAERAARLLSAAHVCVHELDPRKGLEFSFNWDLEMKPMRCDLAAQLKDKLSKLESIPFQRRSFFQRAMLETLEGRLISLEAAFALNLRRMQQASASRRRVQPGDVSWFTPRLSQRASDRDKCAGDEVAPAEPDEEDADAAAGTRRQARWSNPPPGAEGHNGSDRGSDRGSTNAARTMERVRNQQRNSCMGTLRPLRRISSEVRSGEGGLAGRVRQLSRTVYASGRRLSNLLGAGEASPQALEDEGTRGPNGLSEDGFISGPMIGAERAHLGERSGLAAAPVPRGDGGAHEGASSDTKRLLDDTSFDKGRQDESDQPSDAADSVLATVALSDSKGGVAPSATESLYARQRRLSSRV